MTAAKPTNTPRWTGVQVALWAYCANTAGWLFWSTPLGWNRLTTAKKMKPPPSSIADRRSNLRSARRPVRVSEIWVPFAIDISLLPRVVLVSYLMVDANQRRIDAG